MSGVVLGGVARVVGSSLIRGKIFTASIGSVVIYMINFGILTFMSMTSFMNVLRLILLSMR